MLLRRTLELSVSSVLLVLLAGRSPAVSEESADYLKQIKPVLLARCAACHGALKQEAGLRIDTAAAMIRGGDSGPAIHAGDVAASTIIERVSAAEESARMPPEGEPLTPAQIAALKSWIAAGAHAPADEQPERDPRDHWAFRQPVRPIVPQTADFAWSVNPIDAFIAAKHQEHGLTPQPAADKRTWLRRVSLDLVGLPPTLSEQTAFLADNSPAAYDAVANRLLESPQYGERWGRHWMDVWRYSDWWGLGEEVRNSQKHIWHWRDWIIESLNADKGYDQMLREMLAADELYPNDPDRLRASGFLARQYFKFNRTSWLDETIEHTSKAMLGLTFNCAKCHDHKYDPFSQPDYYRFRAFFEPYQVRTDAVPGVMDFEQDGIPRAFDCNLEAQTFLHIRGDDRNPNKDLAISPLVPAFLSFAEFPIETVALPAEAYQPGLRPFVVEAHLKQAAQRIKDAQAEIAKARQRLAESEAATPQPADALKIANNPAIKQTLPLPLDQAQWSVTIAEQALRTAELQPASIQARAAADQARHQSTPPTNLAELIATAVRAERMVSAAKAEEDLSRTELEVLKATADKRGEAEKKRESAQAALLAARQAVNQPGDSFTSLTGSLKTLENNLETEESRRKPFPQTSTGRRSALAKWITDAQHPLTARVAVNHLWGRHFGKGIVPTVFDFGRKGTPPTHPELLDWLAVELTDHGWSMKHLHRLIVTSQTYRMTSSQKQATPQASAADPDNKFLWRRNPIRMEAQIVRDSLLHLAGELDLKQGGPSIPVKDEQSRRRSLYFVHSHNEHQKFLSTFDDASVLECYRRSESIVPQQALALENSPLAAAMAEKIAQRLHLAQPNLTDQDFARQAFVMILANDPTEGELLAAVSALEQLTTAAKNSNRPHPESQARTNLIVALLNHNDFVTIR